MEIPDILEDILLDIIDSNEVKSHTTREASKMLQEIQDGDKVFLLKKAIYGLKQAGQHWHKILDVELKNLGLTPLESDPCVYTAKTEEDTMIVVVYVDDMFIASKNLEWIQALKSNLSKKYASKDLGEIRHRLGMEFNKNQEDLQITQKMYTKKILDHFGMTDSKPVQTALDPNVKLLKPESSSNDDMKLYPYRELIGSLMYLAVATRPDIAYAVNFLSQFNTCYTKEHWIAGKRVLRYLKGTPNSGIKFSKCGKDLQGYIDADWGSCTDDRRSYTGYAFILVGAAVSWEAKK